MTERVTDGTPDQNKKDTAPTSFPLEKPAYKLDRTELFDAIMTGKLEAERDDEGKIIFDEDGLPKVKVPNSIGDYSEPAKSDTTRAFVPMDSHKATPPPPENAAETNLISNIALDPVARQSMTRPEEGERPFWTTAKKRGIAVTAILSVLTPIGFGVARFFGNNDNTVVAQPGTSTSGPATPGPSGAPSTETSASPSSAETLEIPKSDMDEAKKFISRNQIDFLGTGSDDQQLGVDGEMLLHQLGGPESSIFYQDTSTEKGKKKYVFDVDTGETIGSKSPILRALVRQENGETGHQSLQDIRNQLGAQGMADELTYALATMFGARNEGGDIDTLNVDKGANLGAGLFLDLNSPEAKKYRGHVNNQTTTEFYSAKNRWTDAEVSDDVMEYRYNGKTYKVVVINFVKDGDQMHAIVTSRDTEFTGPNPRDSKSLVSLDISKLQIISMDKGLVDVNEQPEPQQEQ